MARKLPDRYECEICHRTYETMSNAKICESNHYKVDSVVDNCFEEPNKFKYPTRIVCQMQDGTRISYYRKRV